MGRPSLADRRRAEILRAAARTVAEHGLAGSTQERIAAAAGMSRSHVRHYVGNRDELIHALWEHVMTPYFTELREVMAGPPAEARMHALVDHLFGPQMAHNEDNLVIDALINGAMHDVRLRGRIYESYSRLEQEIARAIREASPGCDHGESRQLAYALICMAFGYSTLAALPFPATRQKGMKNLALRLVATLDERAAPAADLPGED
ncbi:TetR/AcrR family transcriptional regulator [Actinocorallia populi]|uniref:TetR/AcrR family transcriptional regulator n=1 Tax=Actinocorallia populi TaxID=2079200 RepID=UPI0022B7FA10|nr:TetR/AcrR family transcriptional regulator [Actinocorallia populi]